MYPQNKTGYYKIELSRGWRDGSEVKNTDCSSRGPEFRGPEFNSQQPHGGSQPSIMRTGTLFCPVGIHGDRMLYT